MSLPVTRVFQLGLLSLALAACTSAPNVKSPNTNSPQVDGSTTGVQNNGNNYRTNKYCIDMLKEYEGLRLTAYQGPGVTQPWLIGYGHKATAREGMVITEDKAIELRKSDLVDVEQAIQRLVSVNLNENQFSAISCFAYNMGTGNLASSTLLKKLNQADYEGAANEFWKWRRIGPDISQHLVDRREKETALFRR
jgi:lysozyme